MYLFVCVYIHDRDCVPVSLGVMGPTDRDGPLVSCLQVLVSPRSILANGGIISAVGLNAVALAAKHHAAPFVVIAGLYKLSPVFPHQADVTLNEFGPPSAICDVETLAMPLQGDKHGGSVQVVNPLNDYVPPDLIDLFVTDTGGHTSSYIYRLLAEYYHKDDYHLE